MNYIQFFQAAAEGDTATLQSMLDAGADPNWTDPAVGHSALYNASTTNQPAAVRMLLAHGADPNLRMDYHSPVDGRKESGIVALMFARSADVVEALVAAGADVNAVDSNGITSLMRACHWGKHAVAKALLAEGANPSKTSQHGSNARDIAVARIEDYRSLAFGSNEEAVAKRIEVFEDIVGLLDSIVESNG